MRPSRRLVAFLASTAILTGCSGGADEAGTDPTAASTASGDGTASGGGTAAARELQDAAGPDAEPQPLKSELTVLATRETTDNTIPLAIDLNSVSVSGETMSVVFTARNLSDDDKWQIAGYFDDGLFSVPLDDEGARSEDSAQHAGTTTDGVAVLDPVNATVHRAAYDAGGSCACDVDLNSAFVGAGEAMVLTTAFAAVPEDVKTVTVQIPGAGAFENVPVSR